jgi:hypothetical protein
LGDVFARVAISRDVPDHAHDRPGVAVHEPPERLGVAVEDTPDYIELFCHSIGTAMLLLHSYTSECQESSMPLLRAPGVK